MLLRDFPELLLLCCRGAHRREELRTAQHGAGKVREDPILVEFQLPRVEYLLHLFGHDFPLHGGLLAGFLRAPGLTLILRKLLRLFVQLFHELLPLDLGFGGDFPQFPLLLGASRRSSRSVASPEIHE